MLTYLFWCHWSLFFINKFLHILFLKILYILVCSPVNLNNLIFFLHLTPVLFHTHAWIKLDIIMHMIISELIFILWFLHMYFYNKNETKKKFRIGIHSIICPDKLGIRVYTTINSRWTFPINFLFQHAHQCNTTLFSTHSLIYN